MGFAFNECKNVAQEKAGARLKAGATQSKPAIPHEAFSLLLEKAAPWPRLPPPRRTQAPSE
jgi:hypothetical protein